VTENWGRPADVFGEKATLHPVTGRYIETGIGAHPEEVQVRQHLAAIEQELGKGVADRMREEIKFLAANQEQHT
jgi:hypothetical protein